MKSLGLTGDKFTVRYGVISRHIGKDAEHSLPLEVWEQLPNALQTPFAITRYYEDEHKQKQKGYRLYTTIQLQNGSFVVSAEVKDAGRNIEVNSINTVFGRNKLSYVHDELIYTSEKITPEQQALLNGNNPHQYPNGREYVVLIDLFFEAVKPYRPYYFDAKIVVIILNPQKTIVFFDDISFSPFFS